MNPGFTCGLSLRYALFQDSPPNHRPLFDVAIHGELPLVKDFRSSYEMASINKKANTEGPNFRFGSTSAIRFDATVNFVAIIHPQSVPAAQPGPDVFPRTVCAQCRSPQPDPPRRLGQRDHCAVRTSSVSKGAPKVSVRPRAWANRSEASNSQAKTQISWHHSRLRSIPLPTSARAASSPRITALRQIVEAGNSVSSATSSTASTSSGGINTQMRSNGLPPLRLVRVNLPSRPFSAGGSFSKCGGNSGGGKNGGSGGAGILRACCCAVWAVCGDIFGAIG
jgi:hypothetical protein